MDIESAIAGASRMVMRLPELQQASKTATGEERTL